LYVNIKKKKINFYFHLRIGIEGILRSAATVILWAMKKDIKVLTLRFESKMKDNKSSKGREKIMYSQMCLAFYKIPFLHISQIT